MAAKARLRVVSVLLLAAASAFAYAQEMSFDKVTSVATLPNGIALRDGDATLQITALRDDVLRVRASRYATMPEDASWAVLAEARKSAVKVTALGDGRVGFTTSKLRVSIERCTGLMTVTDLRGTVLQQQKLPLKFEKSGFAFGDAMPMDEHYFGLGDKTGGFDHREQAFRMWNTDAYAWQESTDPLYKSIPFFMTYRAGVSLGVLIDNTWASSFDFGKTLGDTFQYRAEGGAFDMYLLYGPSAKQVLASYAWLTGPTPLPPLWALGFQQSRYSYMTAARVEEVAGRLRADKIPADAVYLDIDYQDRNRPFTVDAKTFPDLPGLVAKLHAEHFHVVAITDLHIANAPNQGYAPFDSGTAGDHFVKKADGSVFVGKVWPGPSVFPDFTQSKTRVWWGSLYKPLDAAGVDGFWNDMNEPSVFDELKTMPKDVVHRIDEPGFAKRTATHLEIHDVYGMENSRATYDGQLALRPDVRPFVLTRASYAGGQRYAATWTGDNSATWNHLRITTPMLKNLGLSGFSMSGADVGGYAGTPSTELLTKWLEIAAFQPIDRDHAEKGTGDHEPWVGGAEQEAVRRKFIETRYQLLPYIYTAMEENTRTGMPLLRPLFLEFPDAASDRHALDLDPMAAGEFLMGPDLLVAAPPYPDKMDAYEAELPSAGWYDFWTGKRVNAGSTVVQAAGLQPESATGAALTTVTLRPQLEELPVFVRPGAILPLQPLVQSTEEMPVGPLTLRVFPGPDCHGALYSDDGKSFGYMRGESLRMTFACKIVGNDRLDVEIGAHEGGFPAWWKEIAVKVEGSGKILKAIVGGKNADVQGDEQQVVIVKDDGHGAHISLTLAQ